MAKNKKPRKRRNANKGNFVYWVGQDILDYINNMTTTLGLQTFVTLRTGRATEEMMCSIADAFNLCQVACRERTWIPQEDRQAVVDCIEDGIAAFRRTVLRAYENEPRRFVFTGDDLRAVQDATEQAILVIRSSVEDGALNQLCKEINIMVKETATTSEVKLITTRPEKYEQENP